MSHYTLNDIEKIRKVSGISYQEAVSLLEYHNGDVALAMVDLEKNGRIRNPSGDETGAEEKEGSRASERNLPVFLHVVAFLYQTRIHVTYRDQTVINLSVVFLIISAVFSPYLILLGAILALAFGYRISFVRNDSGFVFGEVRKNVERTRDTVKSSIETIRQGTANPQREEEPSDDAFSSFFQNRGIGRHRSQPAGNHSEVPTIHVPVQVRSEDGSVSFRQDSDGYNQATIE